MQAGTRQAALDFDGLIRVLGVRLVHKHVCLAVGVIASVLEQTLARHLAIDVRTHQAQEMPIDIAAFVLDASFIVATALEITAGAGAGLAVADADSMGRVRLVALSSPRI